MVHEAKAKCLVMSSEVLRNWTPPGSQPHLIPFLPGLQWTFAPSRLGQPPLQSCKLSTSLRTWFNSDHFSKGEEVIHYLGIPTAPNFGSENLFTPLCCSYFPHFFFLMICPARSTTPVTQKAQWLNIIFFSD